MTKAIRRRELDDMLGSLKDGYFIHADSIRDLVSAYREAVDLLRQTRRHLDDPSRYHGGGGRDEFGPRLDAHLAVYRGET